MGKKCKKVECPAGEKWAVPTADFFSLLLALFIALYALASVNKEKIRAVKEEFVKIYDYAPVPVEMSPVQPTDSQSDDKAANVGQPSGQMPVANGGSLLQQSIPVISQGVKEAVADLEEEMQSLSEGDGALDQSMDGVLLKLPATVPFRGSNATVDDEEMHLFIKRVADIIKLLPESVDISVRGFTDNAPIPSGSQYRDNLELSGARAATVVRELIQNGIAPDRLSSAGFGTSQPVASNTTEANRAKNRRVEFYMFVRNDKPIDQKKQQSVLDALEKLPR